MALLSRQEIPVLVQVPVAFGAMILLGDGQASEAIVNWLFKWQTLLAAGVALIGAWFTVRRIREQINLAEEHEADRTRRVHQSRIAALPLALSSLCAYLRQVYDSLEEGRALQGSSGNQGLVQHWQYPELAPELLVELQRYLEAADQPNAIKLVTGIFQQLQTLSARMRDLTNAGSMAGLVGVQRSLVEYQFQTATIYSMVEALFPFARGEASSPPESIDRSTVIVRLDIFSNHAPPDQEFQTRLNSFSAPSSPAWPRDPFDLH